ncbi:MAG: glycosyltransferase, partial [Ferrovibrio sp.]
RFMLNKLSTIFGVCPRQLRAFKKMYPTETPDFWVPNPVQKFSGPEVRPPEPDRPITFVNVGRYDYQKGQDILIRAFAQLRRDRPDVQLRLVGYGSDEPDLRRQIDALGLGPAVTLEYYPTTPEIPLGSSDIFVSASRWEGWPLAICEALRFGLPVVSTDCDFGPSDILTDRRLGRLVSAGDEGALTSEMRYYCDNIAAERAHAAFRREAIDAYSAERVVHVHSAALKSAVGR